MLTLTLVAALAGCDLTPHYQQPTAAIENSWDTDYVTVDAPEAAQGKFYQDERVIGLIKLAAAHNSDLKIAALNLLKMREQYALSKRAYYPELSATLAQTAAHEPAGLLDTYDTGAITYHQADVKLTASWELDLWGRLRNLREAELNQFLAETFTARALKLSLQSQLVTAYLTFLHNREQVRLSGDELAVQQKMLQMLQQAGSVGEDVHQLLLTQANNFQQAADRLSEDKLQMQKSYNGLTLLLGTRVPAAAIDGIAFDHNWRLVAADAGTPSTTLLRRPDVIAAELRLKAANADIGAARAAFFPAISLTAAGGSSSASLDKLFSPATAAWSFAPTLTLPIFNVGQHQAKLADARLSQRVAAADYQKTIQTAFRDVSDGLAEVATRRHQEALARQGYELRLQERDQMQLSLQTGASSAFQLGEKEISLIESRKALAAAQLAQLTAQITLHLTLGGNN